MTCGAGPACPGRSSSNRLAALVDQGLLRKSAYREPGQRSRSEYRLTGKGLDLFPLLVALLEWGDRYAASEDGPLMELRHRDCGAAVRLQLGCTEGHRLGSARDVSPVPGPGARAIA